MKLERRFVPRQKCEVRAAGDTRKIVGHAAVFDTVLDTGWGFTETIARGAFAESIENDDVRALWNHDPNHVLGRNTARTLSLSEDEVGLLYEIDPPDTSLARDLEALIERGDVTGSSFGFITESENWTNDGDQVHRTILKAKLFDVGPVTFPAYVETDVAMRARELGLHVPTPPVEMVTGEIEILRERFRLEEH